MQKEYKNTVYKLEQAMVKFALENDLELYLDDEGYGSGRRLITMAVLEEWASSTAECNGVELKDATIGYNDKGLGDWLYSSEMC